MNRVFITFVECISPLQKVWLLAEQEMIKNKKKSNIQNNNEYFYILAFIPSLKSVLFGSQMTIECYGKVAIKATIMTNFK